MSNTARVIQLRPRATASPPDPYEVYCKARAAFLRSCFEGFPKDHIKAAANEMRRAREHFLQYGGNSR